MLVRIVVTGAAGLIGSVLVPALSEEANVLGVDRRRGRRPGIRRADLTRLGATRAAVRGADVVIDLAARSAADSTWHDVERTNIRISMNVFEASRLEHVPRVIVASSNHVTGLYEREEPYASIVSGRYDGLDPAVIRRIRVGDPVRPDGFYALGKLLAESTGRYYSDVHGLSVMCLRIGTVNQADAPTNPRHFATLLTHADLLQLIRCCIHAPDSLRFGVFYGVSANTWRLWEISDAASAIGFAPQDDAERWR